MSSSFPCGTCLLGISVRLDWVGGISELVNFHLCPANLTIYLPLRPSVVWSHNAAIVAIALFTALFFFLPSFFNILIAGHLILS